LPAMAAGFLPQECESFVSVGFQAQSAMTDVGALDGRADAFEELFVDAGLDVDQVLGVVAAFGSAYFDDESHGISSNHRLRKGGGLCRGLRPST